MEQRRVRLGDILDDYCPRERRLTNHAVVAMIDDQIKQTRCTTCDTEHPYKGAKVPPRRKKADAAAAAAAPPPPATSPVDSGPTPAVVETPAAVAAIVRPARRVLPEPAVDVPEPPASAPAGEATGEAPAVAAAGDQARDEGPVHRRLIRAVLPRPEGHVPERKIPEFTIREAAARANQRPGGARGAGGRPGKFARPPGKAGRPGKGGHGHGQTRPGVTAPSPHAGQKPPGPGGQRARHHFGRGGGKKSGR